MPEQKRKIGQMIWVLLFFCLPAYLTGCAAFSADETRYIQLVVEEGPGYHIDGRIYQIPAGTELSFLVTPLDGWSVTGCDYEGAVLETVEGGSVRITLPDLRYSTAVAVLARQNPFELNCYLDDITEAALTRSLPASHLRVNTPSGSDGISLISEDGKRLLAGWNTRPNGTGEKIGLGSRVLAEEGKPLSLYGDYREVSPASDFLFEKEPSGSVTITGYRGQDEDLVIPPYLGEGEVTAIGRSAFSGAPSKTVLLPPTLKRVGFHAFFEAALEELTFYDSLSEITDYAFENCHALHTIRIQAVRPPVFSGSYFDSFPDKMDRLRLLERQAKIVLFSGSSTRFGYDSARIDEAFPGLSVVNMGVFAYSNALPQFDLILRFMGEGDILVHTPEFDAKDRQFVVTNAMDPSFFSMIESDFDLLQLLDYQDYGGLLSAFSSWQKLRFGMKAGDYSESPSAYDENHEPVSTPSYNEYGDYILYRRGGVDDAPIYDLPVDYFPEAFPKARYLDPINALYQRFLDKGVRVFFAYAPRNGAALSEKSTPEARAALDTYLRQNLKASVLSGLEESLYPGRYLSGTDNHLSTEGVQIRTARFIRDLKKALES